MQASTRFLQLLVVSLPSRHSCAARLRPSAGEPPITGELPSAPLHGYTMPPIRRQVTLQLPYTVLPSSGKAACPPLCCAALCYTGIEAGTDTPIRHFPKKKRCRRGGWSPGRGSGCVCDCAREHGIWGSVPLSGWAVSPGWAKTCLAHVSMYL